MSKLYELKEKYVNFYIISKHDIIRKKIRYDIKKYDTDIQIIRFRHGQHDHLFLDDLLDNHFIGQLNKSIFFLKKN